MRRNLCIYLLAAALALFATAARAAVQPCTLSAPEISAKIRQVGVREMLLGLPGKGSNKGYFKLVGCIWTGEEVWLDIAAPVIAESHPDSEDDLTDAVQNALRANPEGVLSQAWPKFFTIQNYICSLSVSDYSVPHTGDRTNYRNAMVELDRREAAVKQIKRPELKDRAAECLASFEKTRTYFTHLFKMGKPAPGPGTAPPLQKGP